MNVLSLVMGLLLIFTCTFSLSLRKAVISQGIEKTYEAHMNASRKIGNSYESLCFNRMRSKPTETKEKQTERPSPQIHAEPLNLNCARLNLTPLIQDGKEKHLVLYETAAQLIRSLYAQALFADKPRFEYRLLDALLDSAKSSATDHLEKLSLSDYNVKPLYIQTIYYRMLRGTKKSSDGGYPSFLDCFTIENKESRICLKHASSEMLAALFGPHAAPIILRELKESGAPLLPDRIREICAENGKIGVSDDFLHLLDFNSSPHQSSGEKTLVKDDADVSLRQRVFLPT